MMNKLKMFYNDHFGPPTAVQMAEKELGLARKHLLEHLTHTEYYQAQVDFEKKRIKRLEAYLSVDTPQENVNG